MRDFNSYKSTSNVNNKDAMDMLKNLASKYEGASKSDLVSAIKKEAEKGRRNGTLSDADIDNFKNMLKPLLNAKQAAELEKIVSELKNS